MTQRSGRARGPAPEDAEIFGAAHHERLRAAVRELSWLLSRGYAPPSALALVGNRHQLTRRQRLAVGQCACADADAAGRADRQLSVGDLAGRALTIDGFNVLITLEAALSGALILTGRDGAWRDLSQLLRAPTPVAAVAGGAGPAPTTARHYHPVGVTTRAAELVAATLGAAGAGPVAWCLDRPVSNSGRLRALLLGVAEAAGVSWEVTLTDGTDRAVAAAPEVAASSDSWILDRAPRWVDLPAAVLAAHGGAVWRLDLAAAR